MKKLNVIGIIYSLTLIELLGGGGGRMLQIGPLTMRMYLFIIGLVLSISIIIVRKRLPRYVLVFALINTISISIPILVGLINNATLSLIVTDVKPLLFVYFIFITHFYINKLEDIDSINKLIKITSIIMAIAYLIVLSLLLSSKIDFYSFNRAVAPYDEFFFRGNLGFFAYKGFLYLGIGLIFWFFAHKNSLRKYIILVIILIALTLTGTRGYLAGLGVVFLISVVIPRIFKGKLYYFLVVIPPVILSLWFFTTTNLGNKVHSDSIRLIQVAQVAERITPLSLLIGHGFGIGIPIREVHMEIAYLEIFHKQGLLGLTLYLLILTLIYIRYISLQIYKSIARPYFFGCIFIILLSVTNSYINNPIGLTVLILTYVIINKLYYFEKTENISLHSNLQR